MEDKNQFVDQLLDSALAHWQKAEPRPGLEARILENVRTADRKHAQTRWPWAPRTAGWVLVVAMVVVVATVVYVAYLGHGPAVQAPYISRNVSVLPQHKELAANPKATPKSNHATTVLEARRAARKVRTTPRRTEAHHWPSQFPTPAPLTKEEKALVHYVQETPPEVLAKPLIKEQATFQPIDIKPLVIRPVEMKPLSLGTTNEEIQ